MDIFQQHRDAIIQALPNMVAKMTVEARNFFDESWTRKGFLNGGVNIWMPVKDRKTGGIKERPLVESGRLRRSLRTKVAGLNGIVFTEVPYAEVHNEGGHVSGTFRVRSHSRRNGQNVKAHQRTVNYTMPQRQFMGDSTELEVKLKFIAEQTLQEII